MTRTFEINYSDLNEAAQKRYLKFQSVTSPEELNTDCCPLAYVEIEERFEIQATSVGYMVLDSETGDYLHGKNGDNTFESLSEAQNLIKEVTDE